MAAELCDLRSVRDNLKMSQNELAALLGVSIRAVQSYEQGWRKTPPYVQKLAGLLVQFNWQRKNKPQPPCWKTKQCSSSARSECAAFQFQRGDICWLVTGNMCDGKRLRNWEAKLTKCLKCPVMKKWNA